ncbi:MAG: DUF4398 domain-containing protein [Pseudomonadales bacterium]
MSRPNRYHIGGKLAGAAGVVSLVLLLGACSATPIEPTSSLDAARVAIANAEKADANQYAAAELDNARQKLLLAIESVGIDTVESMTTADRLAQEAQLEAELAIARTESKKAAAINKELTMGADALAEEMKRAGEQQ